MVVATRLAHWRDMALVLLAIEAVLLALLPAAAIYLGLRGLRRLRQWLSPALFEARLYVWRVRSFTCQVMDAVATWFVWLQSTAVGLQRTLERLQGRQGQ